MPVYIRKNVNFTPESLADATCEDNDDDFVQDPDQVKDRLPQPYRMIDKVVTSIFERAWNYISSREEERVLDATRDKPPQYECGTKLQDHGSACCMKSSPNGGEVIVMGLPNGLSVIQASTQKTLCVFYEDKMEIVSIHISCIGEQTFLISTIDDMGVGRIFGLQGEQIYLIQTFTEGDGSNKGIISQCEVSRDGEFLGLCFENTADNEVWLEMHKLPKEQLLKELESCSPKETKESKESKDAGISRKGASSPVMEVTEPPAGGEEEEPQSRSNSPSSRLGSATHTRSTHKFPSSTIILKIKQPQPIAGASWSSPYTASKAIDATGEIIGSGGHHLVSTHHLEQRDTVFQQLHQQHIQYMQSEQQQQQHKTFPTFHFVSGGRLLPHGLSGIDPAGPITAIIVCWQNHPQLAFYSLAKPAKELEHKPELVWPLAGLPATSAVSPCSSLLAVATVSNNILIWDKYMGQPRPIEHVPVSGRITALRWLPISSPDQTEPPAYPPYRLTAPSSLLVTSSGGDMIVLYTGCSNTKTPRNAVNSDIQRAEEMFTQLLTVDSMPQLLVSVRRNGQVFLQDVTTADGKRSSVCEVMLPAGFSLPTPWEPALAVGANGAMLYIRGHQENLPPPAEPTATPPPSPEEREEGEGEHTEQPSDGQVLAENIKIEPPVNVDSVFVYTLRSFPDLDKYRSSPAAPPAGSSSPSLETLAPPAVVAPSQESTPYMTHSTVEKRVAAVLTDRLKQQTARKDVMQERWQQLQDELGLLRRLRHEREKKQEVSGPTFSASSIPRTPII